MCVRFLLLVSSAIAIATFASGAVTKVPQEFAPCTDANTRPELAQSLCLSATLPFWHDKRDDGRTAEVFVRKFPATRSKGSVWLVAGGPGESGASLYPHLKSLRKAFAGLDLLIPDHRGTGFSTRLCPKEEAVTSPGGASLIGDEWASCIGSLWAKPEDVAAFSITQAARDLDRLMRDHPAKGRTFVYGVSYGSQLVLRMLSLTDIKIDGVIFDSLVPIQTDERFDLSRRSQVVDEVGREILMRCDSDPACRARSKEPASRRLQHLYAQLSALPKTIEGQTFDDIALKGLLGQMLDVPEARQQILDLVLDIETGRTERLSDVVRILKAASSDAYPQSPISIPLVSVISASENTLRPKVTAAEIKAEQDDFLFTSPLPALLAGNGMPTYGRDAFFGTEPNFLPPTLVLQGTLDPKTPYVAAREHIARLPGRSISLITVESAPHFILWAAPRCFETEIADFIGRVHRKKLVRPRTCALTPSFHRTAYGHR